MTAPAARLLRLFLIPAGIAVLSAAVMLGGESWIQALRYDRDAIAGGELWRLLTAHFTHLGWRHLGMNLAGLFLIWALFGRLLPNGAWLLGLLGTALVVSLGLWWFDPGLHWYVGLSGVLHGLFMTGVLLSLYLGYRAEFLLLVLILGKLAWEQLYGPLPGSADFAGGRVIVDAHLYGAVAGVLAAIALIGRQLLRAGRQKARQ